MIFQLGLKFHSELAIHFHAPGIRWEIIFTGFLLPFQIVSVNIDGNLREKKLMIMMFSMFLPHFIRHELFIDT